MDNLEFKKISDEYLPEVLNIYYYISCMIIFVEYH